MIEEWLKLNHSKRTTDERFIINRANNRFDVLYFL